MKSVSSSIDKALQALFLLGEPLASFTSGKF